jgi:RimJ/RimL family protein N-acetyltransferase
VIQGVLVDLRPLVAADVERYERLANDPDYQGPYGTFALGAAGDVQRRFEQDGYLSHQHGRLVVVDKEGIAVGGASYIAVFHGPPPSNVVYNIGIDIDPAARRRGYGAEAQSLLSRYLFDIYLVERVEASVDVENVPEQRALERAGFTREGVLRHAQWRAGAWHDLVLYSRLRGE